MISRIYITTNLINGKVYIGQTSHNRKGYIGGGHRLRMAIKKYGKHNFINETIAIGEFTSDELDLLETLFIKSYNSRNPEIGYNLESGGNKLKNHSDLTKKMMSELRSGEKHNRFGVKLSNETKLKISDAHRGKKMSNEFKEKMSIVTSGKNNPFYGKHHTQESKDKRKETIRIKKLLANSK